MFAKVKFCLSAILLHRIKRVRWVGRRRLKIKGVVFWKLNYSFEYLLTSNSEIIIKSQQYHSSIFIEIVLTDSLADMIISNKLYNTIQL